MVGHGGSSAGLYLADPTSPIPSHCAVIILFKVSQASIVVTSTLRVKMCEMIGINILREMMELTMNEIRD